MALDEGIGELLQVPCNEFIDPGMGAVEVQEAFADAGQVEAEGVFAAGDVGGVELEDVAGVEEGAGFGEELPVDEEGAEAGAHGFGFDDTAGEVDEAAVDHVADFGREGEEGEGFAGT